MKKIFSFFLPILLCTTCLFADNTLQHKTPIPLFNESYSGLVEYLKPIIAAKNLGSGSGIYQGTVGRTLNFITLIAGTNVSLTPAINTITIAASGGSSFAYGYIDNIGSQTVNLGANTVFNQAGILSGVTHTAGSTNITITNAGTYSIEYGITTSTGNVPFQLVLDGTPVTGTIGASVTDGTQITGQVVVSVTAGQVVTLQNISGTTGAVLIDGSASNANNTNAYVLIRQLA